MYNTLNLLFVFLFLVHYHILGTPPLFNDEHLSSSRRASWPAHSSEVLTSTNIAAMERAVASTADPICSALLYFSTAPPRRETEVVRAMMGR
jgi:hypothetical protein